MEHFVTIIQSMVLLQSLYQQINNKWAHILRLIYLIAHCTQENLIIV